MNDLGIAPNPGPFSQEMLDMVAGVFPSVPIAQVKFLLEVNGNDPDAATNLILEGVSLPSLLPHTASIHCWLVFDADTDFRTRVESGPFVKGNCSFYQTLWVSTVILLTVHVGCPCSLGYVTSNAAV